MKPKRIVLYVINTITGKSKRKKILNDNNVEKILIRKKLNTINNLILFLNYLRSVCTI